MSEQTKDSVELKPWIEPEIRTLEIAETHAFFGVGADGSSYPDCTRS